MDFNDKALIERWEPVLAHEAVPEIKDHHRKMQTAILLENTEKDMSNGGTNNASTFLNEAAPTNNTTGVANYDPILINLVRRAMPNLIAYDVAGVQAMTGPSGLVFAMRSHYGAQNGTEAFFNEPETGWSARLGSNTSATNAGYASATAVGGANGNVGTTPGSSNNAGNNTFNFAGGLNLGTAEGLGSNTTAIFPEMSLTIEKVTATAKSRKLKAEFSQEMSQDLKAIHGLDVESELSNMLASALLADINREVIRTIIVTSKTGCLDTTTPGTFDCDVDSNGRWLVEKHKGLMFRVEQESNAIAKASRAGRGNIIICSSDVASALQMAGVLDYAPALAANNLQIDDTGVTFAGILNKRVKVFIDPYASGNWMVVGYKGSTPADAGLFYCPYIPLQKVMAVDPNTFQPKIGYSTRYAMVASPFAEGLTVGNGALNQDSNVYYRKFVISNLS